MEESMPESVWHGKIGDSNSHYGLCTGGTGPSMAERRLDRTLEGRVPPRPSSGEGHDENCCGFACAMILKHTLSGQSARLIDTNATVALADFSEYLPVARHVCFTSDRKSTRLN